MSYSIVLDGSSSTLRRCSSNLILLLKSAASLFNLFLILRVQFCRESAQFFCSNSVSESAQFCSESAQLCSEPAQLRQRVLSFLHTYMVRSPFRQWVLSFCILHEEFRYFVLCTQFKNVLCILY